MTSQTDHCSNPALPEVLVRLDLLCDVALDVNGAWSDLEAVGYDAEDSDRVDYLRELLHGVTRQIHTLRDRVRQAARVSR